MQTAYFVRWCLVNLFNVARENIKFLVSTTAMNPSYIDYDDIATYANVRYYIDEWLVNKPGSLFVYVIGHGDGFNITLGALAGGRWDNESDEGSEHYVNGQMKGVDECIQLLADNTFYWDDEMKQDLNWTLEQSVSTIMLQNCYISEISNMSCYSGGFIDDLSSIYARTLITSSNETGISLGYDPLDPTCPYPFSPFTYHFFTSILGYEVEWGGNLGIIVQYDKPINWQYSQSLRGAFEYTLQHDRIHLAGEEFPWFDDDGDGLPTYVNNTEVPDFPWNTQDLKRWLEHDINYDGKVDMKDVRIVAKAYQSYPSHSQWNRQADVFPNEDWKVDMKDIRAASSDYGKSTDP